jgi:hypothetical protein
MVVEIEPAFHNSRSCAVGVIQRPVKPARIDAMIYYPARLESTDMTRPIPESIDSSRRHPLILYAHAKRRFIYCSEEVPQGLDASLADFTADFQRVECMLTHIASHGFVVVAPDLGWLVDTGESGEWGVLTPTALPRARILLALHAALRAGTAAPFGDHADVDRVGLFGHSTGGAACVYASEQLTQTRVLGLIAPAVFPSERHRARIDKSVLVIAGTRDTQVLDAAELYAEFTGAKFLVQVGGANHLGYTDLCEPLNQVCMDLEPAAAIRRSVQQEVAASFLAAVARVFLLGDNSMLPYLIGFTESGAREHLPSLEISHAS